MSVKVFSLFDLLYMIGTLFFGNVLSVSFVGATNTIPKGEPGAIVADVVGMVEIVAITWTTEPPDGPRECIAAVCVCRL